MVDHLRGEVTYLRERLEEADRQRGYLQQQLEDERRRTDVIQALATSTTSDTVTNAVESPESDRSPSTGVMGWVRRRLRG